MLTNNNNNNNNNNSTSHWNNNRYNIEFKGEETKESLQSFKEKYAEAAFQSFERDILYIKSIKSRKNELEHNENIILTIRELIDEIRSYTREVIDEMREFRDEMRELGSDV